MWSDDFAAMSAHEKSEFRRLTNYLLSHTYMTRYEYQPAQQMTVLNPDYRMLLRLFAVMRDYFYASGWSLEKDENYGIISLVNSFDTNRFKIDKFTTLFAYVCRLIYEEGREQAGSFHMVKTDTQTVVEKMTMLGLLERSKTTQKERLEAQRILSHYNIIQKMEAAAWSSEGNQLLITPSILLLISNENINNMIAELEAMKAEDIRKDEE